MATQPQFDGRLIPPAGSRFHSSLAREIAERRTQAIERTRGRLFDRYLSRPTPEKKKKGRDPREALPKGDDIASLADTFGASERQKQQALAYDERPGLHRKAKRIALCGNLGKRQNCMAEDSHRFYRPCRCGCRYCPECGPAWFRKKFSDLLFALPPLIERLVSAGEKRGRRVVIARLDFTVRNTGTMPTPEQVRKFHRNIHRFWRAVERRFGIGRGEYGWAGCDEFGGSNTNLHRHCVYIGPLLPQHGRDVKKLGYKNRRKKSGRAASGFSKHLLSDMWSEVCGEEAHVSIKLSKDFPSALAHALKYPAKFLSQSNPERLADLEAAFHKTRRFSTGGAFYRLKALREPGEECALGSCPICGARLAEVVEGWVPRAVLLSEGRSDVADVRRDVSRQKIFSGQGPP